MPQTVKTVRYGWPNLATVTDASVTDFGTRTIDIPETTSRTFRSVFVFLSFQDQITATGGTITEFRVGMQLAAVATSTITETDDLTSVAENMALVLGPFDFTTYFNTNFGAGSSQSVRLECFFDQSTGTTLGMVNCSIELFITYEYDDSVTTQLKTVCIPLESPVGALSTTIAEIGTNQIPILTGGSGILPESSITFRDYYFIIEGNEHGDGGTTDFTLGVEIDTEGETTFTSSEKALATNRYVRFMWSRSGSIPTTTSTHAFRARTANAASMNHFSVLLVLTYEYDASASTDFFNSVQIPFYMRGPMGGTATTDPQRYQHEFFIPEPTTITLQQSAVRVNVSGQGTITGLNFRVGGQSYRAYTDNLGGIIAGANAFMQRIDSGSAQGAGITIARGANTITIDAYRTGTTVVGMATNGIIYLNYTSGKATGGFPRHTHSTYWHGASYDAAASGSIRSLSAFAPNIPETEYWATVGYWLNLTNTLTGSGIDVSAKIDAGEAEGDGWRQLYCDVFMMDGAVGEIPIWSDANHAFDRHPSDPNPRLIGIETSRAYRLCSPAFRAGLLMEVTYHTITFTLSGTVTPNPGAGVSIDIHRSDTDEKLYTTTTNSSGVFSLSVYDDALTYFAQGRLDATHYGRSNNVTPGTAADIDFDPTGAGGGSSTTGSRFNRGFN